MFQNFPWAVYCELVKAHPALFVGEGWAKNAALLYQFTVDIHFQNMDKTLFQSTVAIYFQNAHITQQLRRLAISAFIE